MEKSYDIFGVMREQIADFDQRGTFLIGRPSVQDQFDIRNRGRYGGYYYSQRLTLEACALATASKYRSGNIDSDKKRKAYLNIVNFYKEVAMNQINVNVTNYIFEPEDEDDVWPTFFMQNKFKSWATDPDHMYDDTIDDLANDFCGYGSCVAKRVGKVVERIPLRTLRNTQTAKSLKDAAENGGYVIIENEMSYNQMCKFKGWKLDGVSKKKPSIIFEKYGIIPKAKIVEWNGGTPTDDQWDEWVLSVQVVCPKMEKWAEAGSDETDANVLFLAQIKRFPLEEAHYEKIDGRWLGRGEIEKQLENQIARNLTVNLRHRNLLWATKKIFQSSDDSVAQNLMLEIQDGGVVYVKPNGQLSQVNVQTQHNADFNADDQAWDANSQKISFAFEAATGEAMPSGTPFRLGAILSNAVSKYFKRKQDTFSNFLQRSFFNQIIPIFIEENDDAHTIIYSTAHKDFPMVQAAMIVAYANQLILKEWKAGHQISYDNAEAIVRKEMMNHKILFIKIPSSYYADIRNHMTLNINNPIASSLETLATTYQSMQAMGDPRAENVLNQIYMLQGKNLPAIAGAPVKQNPQPQQASPGTQSMPSPMGFGQPQPQQ